MGQQRRIVKLFAELEATPGTPETLVAADAVRTAGIERLRYLGDRVERMRDRPEMGNFESVNVKPHFGLSSFRVPFIGSGDVDTQPPWADLLLACATAETDDSVANDEWYYTPVDNGFKSVTVMVTEELVQQQSEGCRGNFMIEASPGQLPVFVFSDFLGKFNRPVQLALTSPDDSAYQDAVPVTYSNTSVLTIGGESFPVAGFTFDAGVQVARKNEVNREETVVVDRRPSGSIIFSPAAYDDIIAALADVESHNGVSTNAIILQHGSGAGNIMHLDIKAAQFTDVTDQEVDGETYFSMPFNVLPDASGDEWQLTQK